MSTVAWVVVALSETPLRLGLLAGLLGLLVGGAVLVVWLGRRRTVHATSAIEGEDAAAAWRAEVFPAAPSADGYLLQDPGWGGSPAEGDTPDPVTPEPAAPTPEVAGSPVGQSPDPGPGPQPPAPGDAVPPTRDWPEPAPPRLDAWTRAPEANVSGPSAESEFVFADSPGWVPPAQPLPLNLLDDDPDADALPPELRSAPQPELGDDTDSPFGQSPDPSTTTDRNRREARSFREQLLNESPDTTRPDPRDLFGT